MVEHIRVTEDTIRGEIEKFSKKIEQFDLPSDGLVLVYDDLAYGKVLEEQPNSQEIPSHLNGQMRQRRQH